MLFTDIEGSTAQVAALGSDRWEEVLELHAGILRAALAQNDGAEVRTEGDAFFAVFTSASAALAAAVAAQRGLHAADWPHGAAVRVRMGLHTGEVIAEDGDFFGKNVILAARIAAQATGGEILVSERMREAAEGHGSEGPEGTDLRFDSGRELELKGLAGTHMVYSAEWERSETVEVI